MIVYEHIGDGWRYYGITNDIEARWRNGYGYKGEKGFPQKIRMESCKAGKCLRDYWNEDMEHKILYDNESQKGAELIESLLILRNRKNGEVLNLNNGAGMKWIKGKEEMGEEELIAALMKEYEKERKANETIEWGE